MTSPPKTSGSRSIVPCLTTGVRPSAIARATTDLARIGTILLENSGARMNSGVMRVRTRKNAATCCSLKPARSCSGSIFAADRLEVHGLRDVGPEVAGPVHHGAEHPRAGDRDDRDQGEDLRDEGERLLLDLRDGLEDGDREADDEAGEQHRHRD